MPPKRNLELDTNTSSNKDDTLLTKRRPTQYYSTSQYLLRKKNMEALMKSPERHQTSQSTASPRARSLSTSKPQKREDVTPTEAIDVINNAITDEKNRAVVEQAEVKRLEDQVQFLLRKVERKDKERQEETHARHGLEQKLAERDALLQELKDILHD
ncbi:uncharacterized protein K452DRAFT_303643 [Aplosporella prunicola CBS 121167]|uniref:Uncharacterized protein n=1 Tax=Aplosporella prunicola CBS 121167 TaxID=1176127 RepID=A0A6A6AWY5_9PEZI|nr:uncharacterized protein K452DRAFT_303643 [Aplosporella prunicola CBS 121167]KAF2135297.1 hypothetical protein K452DRAFT_303643 [Aplosporella prunicola CBS 121167]